MYTPSDISSRIISAWLPAYLALLVHGASITPLSEFIPIFLFYPAICGIPIIVFTYLQGNHEQQLLEQIGILDTGNVRLAVFILIAAPPAIIASVLAYAHVNGSYEDVAWIVIVFGGLLLNEIGRKILNR